MAEVIFNGKEFIIPKESDFQKLYSKGFAFKDETIFKLSTYEALYLLETGKITIQNKNAKDITFESLTKTVKTEMAEYAVFKDLRQKGHIVKSALKYGFAFRVYEKGSKIGKSHSKWLVDILKESEKLSVRDFAAKCRVAHTTKKDILLAVVDDENSVTYFETSWKKIA